MKEKLSLETIKCTGELDNLRCQLKRHYQALNKIETGKSPFGRFIFKGDLNNKYYMDAKKYPKIGVNFIDVNEPNYELFSKMSAEEILSYAKTPLECLAIAALWKNGDLDKIKHIAAGIAGINKTNNVAPVFKQFGNHLSKPSCEPIADQHTLRAYRYLKEEDLKDPQHRQNVKAQEVMKYVTWVQNIIKHPTNGSFNSDQQQENLYNFDQSMFTLGKATKEFITLGLSM